MKISTASALGLLFGVAIGLIATGRVHLQTDSRAGMMIQEFAWWIVVLGTPFPLADYLTGARTELIGIVMDYPFRHLAAFFTGLSVALGFFLLLESRLLALLSPVRFV